MRVAVRFLLVVMSALGVGLLLSAQLASREGTGEKRRPAPRPLSAQPCF